MSPTIYGEQAVLRLLTKDSSLLEIETLGYHGHTLRVVLDSLKYSNGMILTSGPTGSGKSTSMIAMIRRVVSDEVKIITLEDPVEHKVDGISQIEINKGIGLTFEAGLRSVLRQDPDIILVGEIRDKTTARLAIQAALTGHLVFSTLHTNSAAAILPRLIDMDIEPFLLASVIRTVIGQRLARLLPANKKACDSSQQETAEVKSVLSNVLPRSGDSQETRQSINNYLGYDNLPNSDDPRYRLWEPNKHNGYKGRIGLYEAFKVSSKIQSLIPQPSNCP